jgi:aspartyl protease family protein
MVPGLDGELSSSLLILAVVAALLLAARVPVLRWMIRLVVWGALAALLYVAVDQRGRLGFGAGPLGDLVAADAQRVVGEELRIRMSPDGHFWATVRFGGIERRLLVDSGATLTALNADTAAAAGLEPRDEVIPVILRTANGDVRARTAPPRQHRRARPARRGVAGVRPRRRARHELPVAAEVVAGRGADADLGAASSAGGRVGAVDSRWRRLENAAMTATMEWRRGRFRST